MNVTQALRRIDELQDLPVMISVDRHARGERGVVAVKDCIDAAGLPTTAGSLILDRAPKVADASVVAAARSAGYAIIGKTNMHEFAFGVTSINRHFGTIPNPTDPSRIVGGSSGGSAAAVAYRMCDWSIGTDSGGSVRIPAALCGVVGIKPSRGWMDTSRGIVPLSKSLDTIGPIAGDVETAACALEIMTGSVRTRRRRSTPRLAVPAGWVDDLDNATRDVWDRVRVGRPEIPFPDRRRASLVCNTILYAEAGAVHRRWYSQRPGDYGDDVRRSIEQGLKIKAADYIAALEEREQVSRDVEAALEGWDAVVLPTTACAAPAIADAGDGERLYRFTQPFNVSGHPVVSIPAPVPRGALPVGIQVVGHLGCDWDAVRIAAMLEENWRTRWE